MRIEGAIFDMDGTLVDSLGYWKDVLWPTIGSRYLNDPDFIPDPMTERAVRTLPLREAMDLLHARCQVGESGEALWLLASELCVDFYRTAELKPGGLAFLEHCRQRGIPMCIASATAPDLLQILIDRFSLDRYFSKVFSCGEIGRGKEHPDVFLMAQAHLGTPIDATWVFEDSAVALETAVKAGFQTVGIYDGHNFGAEQVKQSSTVYIGEGEGLDRLIPEI